MSISDKDSVYTYGPLRDNCFRVIELTSLEPDICVQLKDFPDDAPPEYFGLSYAWGSDENTETILCSGKGFKLTPHLKEGLKCIFTKSSCRRLWVDAICINQRDNTEKATQVVKMHHIYRKAAAVYVWLGREEGGSGLAISAINDVQITPRPTEDPMQRILKVKSEAPHLFDVTLFKPIASLSRRSWFRRLWIAQEYFYARSIKFFCGSFVMDNEKFLKVLGSLSIHSFGGNEPPGYRDELELFQGFHALLELQKVKDSHVKGDKLSFFDFVILGRDRMAKEPVDRVYAAFGMAEGVDTIYRKEIAIDYSEDSRHNYWKIYQQFGTVALLHEPNLRLLSAVNTEERLPLLPSWCPNLNSKMMTAALNKYAAGWPFREHCKDVAASTSDLPSKCANHSNFKGKDSNHVSVSSSTSTVHIWGTKIGRISSLSAPWDWDSDFNTEDLTSAGPFARDLLRWLKTNEDFCREHIGDVGKAKYTWGEILVGASDRARRKKPATTATEQDSEAVEGREEKDDSPYVLMKEVWGVIAELDQRGDEVDGQSEFLATFFEAVYTWTLFIQEDWNGRVLFATDCGNLGYASMDVAVGDAVAVLYGGPGLYILRERNNETDEETLWHQFVSESYVFGCMDGQVFDMMDEGVVREKLFAIS